MNTGAVADRIKSVLDERDMTYTDLSNLLEESGISQGRSPSAVGDRLRGTVGLKLEWIFSVADVLNIDYRWLITGDRNGWDTMPRETVTLWSIDDKGEERLLAFDIPKGWPYLNFRIFVENLPRSVSPHITREKE